VIMANSVVYFQQPICIVTYSTSLPCNTGLEQLPIYMLCHVLDMHYIAALMGHKIPTPSTAQAGDTNLQPPCNEGVNGQANQKQKPKKCAREKK